MRQDGVQVDPLAETNISSYFTKFLYIKDIKRKYDPYTNGELIEGRDWKYEYPSETQSHMNFIAYVDKPLTDNASRLLKGLLITNPVTSIVTNCDKCDETFSIFSK